MVTLSHYLTLAAVLFTIGAVGVVVRRNAITILMSIELMLNAANLTFVAFARFPISTIQGVDAANAGHASAFFVIAVAAAEAAVGLAIIIAVFRKRLTTHVDELTTLRDREYAPESLDVAPPAPAHTATGAAHAETH